MKNDPEASVIPEPQSVRRLEGEFELSGDASVGYSGGEDAKRAAGMAAEYLRPATGFELKVKGDERADIVFHAGSGARPDRHGFVEEGYTLEARSGGVQIESVSYRGLINGLETLRQLLPPQIYSRRHIGGVRWSVPSLIVRDRPAFRWRGLHLDVSRHFFSVPDVCRFLELMAIHRFNVFHWHLTDDQGWRLEVQKYPRLTEIGSMRPYTLTGHMRERPRRYDDTPYGGFYSRADVRTVVEFAAKRGITVVPEIDMPGHMQAAVAAYPELGNTDMTLHPRCHWGISQHILNPRESTVQFMQDVLGEVMELFPGAFVHIGGDEAVKTEWSESRSVQDRMLELGLADEDELQSWFIGRMNSFLRDSGRRMIGWDEIMAGGLPEGAAVMSWRNMQYGEKAAMDGYDVVMAPSSHTYFDYYQSEPVDREPLAIGGLTTLEDVYGFDPVPDGLPEEKTCHILGGQGQLWTEYISTLAHLEYMTCPRACALSEALWRGRDRSGYGGFLGRMQCHSLRLNALECKQGPLEGGAR